MMGKLQLVGFIFISFLAVEVVVFGLFFFDNIRLPTFTPWIRFLLQDQAPVVGNSRPTKEEEEDTMTWMKEKGIGGRAVERGRDLRTANMSAFPVPDSKQRPGSGLFYTHDDWPQFPVPPFKLKSNTKLPPTSFNPAYAIQWEFDTASFLQRRHVNASQPKLITWMVPLRYYPRMPQPVRLRVCPEMPCRMTSEPSYANKSGALIWMALRLPRNHLPPARVSRDQVFVIHNHERPTKEWTRPNYFPPAWASVFNWTMSYRSDSDIMAPYGYFYRRPSPLPARNYTAILAQKTKMVAWMVSHCRTQGEREKYVTLLQENVSVDIYGSCGKTLCARRDDNVCADKLSREYKFYLAFENALCPDYVTEKAFRYYDLDVVLVVRADQGCKNYLPPGTYINTEDFKSVKDLADHLIHLHHHPEEYLHILRAKDRYKVMFEEYPIRNDQGQIHYMRYHYDAVPFCELCRRLWELESYRKSIPDVNVWFERGFCVSPRDLH